MRLLFLSTFPLCCLFAHFVRMFKRNLRLPVIFNTAQDEKGKTFLFLDSPQMSRRLKQFNSHFLINSHFTFPYSRILHRHPYAAAVYACVVFIVSFCRRAEEKEGSEMRLLTHQQQHHNFSLSTLDKQPPEKIEHGSAKTTQNTTRYEMEQCLQTLIFLLFLRLYKHNMLVFSLLG